jgi:hypothetical protein
MADRAASELDELVRATRAANRLRGDDGIYAGQLAGLLETGPARLAPRPGESVYHHAGYLAGHQMRWMHERGRALDQSTMLTAAAYGAALADPAGQGALDKADRPVSAHIYAAVRVERKTGQPLSEQDERMFVGWLLEQTDVPATEQLIAKFERLRHRRQERTAIWPADDQLG